MSKIINWIKNNKLSTFLLIVVLFLLLKNRPLPIYQAKNYSTAPAMDLSYSVRPQSPMDSLGIGGASESLALPEPKTLPPTNVSNRMMVKDSYLSLLVENVNQTQELIVKKTEQLGGYLVNSNLNNPQEAATATITIRVPSKKLNQALEYFRELSIKVISENLSGYDVTDQYVDNEARLATLMKTKAKFEEILERATKIEDILNVQREIINLQAQIDSIKGQQQYLEQNSALAKVTIYLSTDELSLPYAPTELWRPEVIFKQAVRSLIGNLRKIGTLIIWLAVYSVIWLPLGLIVYFVSRKRKNK